MLNFRICRLVYYCAARRGPRPYCREELVSSAFLPWRSHRSGLSFTSQGLAVAAAVVAALAQQGEDRECLGIKKKATAVISSGANGVDILAPKLPVDAAAPLGVASVCGGAFKEHQVAFLASALAAVFAPRIRTNFAGIAPEEVQQLFEDAVRRCLGAVSLSLPPLLTALMSQRRTGFAQLDAEAATELKQRLLEHVSAQLRLVWLNPTQERQLIYIVTDVVVESLRRDETLLTASCSPEKLFRVFVLGVSEGLSPGGATIVTNSLIDGVGISVVPRFVQEALVSTPITYLLRSLSEAMLQVFEARLEGRGDNEDVSLRTEDESGGGFVEAARCALARRLVDDSSLLLGELLCAILPVQRALEAAIDVLLRYSVDVEPMEEAVEFLVASERLQARLRCVIDAESEDERVLNSTLRACLEAFAAEGTAADAAPSSPGAARRMMVRYGSRGRGRRTSGAADDLQIGRAAFARVLLQRMELEMCEAACSELFDFLDEDGSGSLDLSELKRIFRDPARRLRPLALKLDRRVAGEGAGGVLRRAHLERLVEAAFYRSWPKQNPFGELTKTVFVPTYVHAIEGRIAEQMHERWAQRRIEAGWSYAPERDNGRKHHDLLRPYSTLSKSERSYNERMALDLLRILTLLGFVVIAPPREGSASEGAELAKAKHLELTHQCYLQPNGYCPRPLDLSAASAELERSAPLLGVVELLAEQAHTLWAVERLESGWGFGFVHNEEDQRSPILVPHAALAQQQRADNRANCLVTMATLLALGFRVQHKDEVE